MALVVFMRGVNVGGHKTFRPAALAKELAALDVVNVGAAGTFVVRKAVSQAKLRAELNRRLPFKAELMICPGGDLQNLVWTNLLGGNCPQRAAKGLVPSLRSGPGRCRASRSFAPTAGLGRSRSWG